MNINGKEFEYSEIDNTFLDEGGDRWTAYDLLEFLRADSIKPDKEIKEYESVWDVVNMDVQEDYDDDYVEIVGLGDVDESEMMSQTASLGDDGLYRVDP
jgi:hypothetical protein